MIFDVALYLRTMHSMLDRRTRKSIVHYIDLCTNMALDLAANLNFLFTEDNASLDTRIKLAHTHGFKAVEIPYPENVDAVVGAVRETGMKVSLMNIALGEKDAAFGTTCIPGAEDAFNSYLEKTVTLAKTLNCQKIHIMAGIKPNQPFEKCLLTYKKNLTRAAEVLARENIVGVIEPINPYSLPNYFLNSFETAQEVLKDVNSENLKLMVDVFHLQLIRGNITNSFRELSTYIGHVQIAQPPHRHEPDVDGELNWPYIFEVIKQSGYKDFIGCEYKPKTNTVDGLKWISNYK